MARRDKSCNLTPSRCLSSNAAIGVNDNTTDSSRGKGSAFFSTKPYSPAAGQPFGPAAGTPFIRASRPLFRPNLPLDPACPRTWLPPSMQRESAPPRFSPAQAASPAHTARNSTRVSYGARIGSVSRTSRRLPKLRPGLQYRHRTSWDIRLCPFPG
jgi:hypothetical protein